MLILVEYQEIHRKVDMRLELSMYSLIQRNVLKVRKSVEKGLGLSRSSSMLRNVLKARSKSSNGARATHFSCKLEGA